MRNCRGMRLDTSPVGDRTARVGARDQTQKKPAFLRPGTVARIRRVTEDEAATQPSMLRAHESGFIRCRLARCVRSGSRRCGVAAPGSLPVGAGDAAHSVLMPAKAASGSQSSDAGGGLAGHIGAHGPDGQTGLAADHPCIATPVASGIVLAGKGRTLWEGQPGSMSVANRPWARVFGERDHGGTNAAQVLLYQLRTLAGCPRREHIDYGNEDEP